MPKKSKEDEFPVWEVRASGIHNQGVFARRKIDAESEIIEYVGERISHEEADRRGIEWEAKANKTGDGAVYLFTLDENWVIDGNDENNPARLINHSCEPNCEAVIFGDGEEAEIWLVSTRDIAKGEELSFDYGFDLENYKDHSCRCGAKACVGYIVGEDYRKQLKKLLKGERAGKNGKAAKKSGRKKRKKHATAKGRES